ncbi:MAG: fumarylacetoacetate hydrolase family protein [Acidobacteriia bacterium]|nr:fumarylacetoacetate hydrolase family protein [Terriglobia bacterium]MYG05000.1 fumarylacetoacetate hydrolase family protein [Terriglobia bacterium]MYK11226.1 fumarylacetoacetate hydrolase family protein [Terriglobia bacterium]
MKLLSFSRGERSGYGAVVGQGVVDLAARYSERWPTLSAVIRAGAIDQLRDLASVLSCDFPLEEVRFLPPILDPGRIICVGLNYRSHIEETGRQMPSYPTLFTRFPDSHVAHGEAIIRPSVSEQHDFEGELAVIIGRSGRYIPAEQALQHVAGYSCYNDGSIRDFQAHTSQFTSGKNFWRSGAFGPWMVTADEIPDPGQLRLETRLNGRIMQSAPTSDLMFDVPALVEYISTVFPLQPADVISTGTTGGVGKARKPPVFMRAGDRIEVELSGIGTLSNMVEDEPTRPQL